MEEIDRRADIEKELRAAQDILSSCVKTDKGTLTVAQRCCANLHQQLQTWARSTKPQQSHARKHKAILKSLRTITEVARFEIQQIVVRDTSISPIIPSDEVQPSHDESVPQEAAGSLQTCQREIDQLRTLLPLLTLSDVDIYGITYRDTELIRCSFESLSADAPEMFDMITKTWQECVCFRGHSMDVQLPRLDSVHAKLAVCFWHGSYKTFHPDFPEQSCKIVCVSKQKIVEDVTITQDNQEKRAIKENGKLCNFVSDPLVSESVTLGVSTGSNYVIEDIKLCHKFPPHRTVTLAFVLKGESKPFASLSSHWTKIAVVLVQAFIQLHPSAWTSPGWSLDNVIFRLNEQNGVDMKQLYLRKYLTGGSKTFQDDDAPEMLAQLLSNICLITTSKSPHSISLDGLKREPASTKADLTNLAGPGYVDAVSWLCENNSRDCSGYEWRIRMQDRVLRPLIRCNLFYCGPRMSSDYPHIFLPLSSFNETAEFLLETLDESHFEHRDDPNAQVPSPISKFIAAQDVMKRHSEVLERLHIAAMRACQTYRPPQYMTHDINEVYTPPTSAEVEHARHFRDLVLGARGRPAYCVILFIVLSVSVVPPWKLFIELVDWVLSASVKSRDLTDDALPLIERQFVQFFGSEMCKEIYDKQFTFCQLPDATFDVCWHRLVERIKTACCTYAIDGSNHTWCPRQLLTGVFSAHQGELAELYDNWAILTAVSQHNAPYLQYEPYWELKKREDLARKNIRSCAVTFATLARCDVPSTSQALLSLMQRCAGRSICSDKNVREDIERVYSGNSSNSVNLKNKFGQEHRSFSPITLTEDSPIILTKDSPIFLTEDSPILLTQEDRLRAAESPCLPLEEAVFIGSGSVGRVFKVSVYANHYQDRSGAYLSNLKLAMKKVDTSGAQEALLYALLAEQELQHDGIAKLRACVVAKSVCYLFTDLADCNLKEYMNTIRPEKPNKQDVRTFFRKMAGIVSAVQYLHDSLQHKLTGEAQRFCHQDLKATNILVTYRGRSLERLKLQITDFGISSVKLRGEAESSARLGDACHNAPPEILKNQNGVAGDIWALGVLCSEYFAWLQGGKTFLDKLEEARRSIDITQRSFVKDENTGATSVKPDILCLFRDFQAEHDSSTDVASLDFVACWDLVTTKMLVCDLEQRKGVSDVATAFSKIISDC